jgi:hypothetical protein
LSGSDAPAEGVPVSIPMAESNSPEGSIVREITRDGRIVIRDDRCAYSFRQIAAGAIEVRMVGTDRGQFGTVIIDEVALALVREPTLELLVDATEGSIMSVEVTTAWARFLEANRPRLRRVTTLATSKATTLAMGLVRYLSNTGDLMRIASDREAYEARKMSISSPQRSGMGD